MKLGTRDKKIAFQRTQRLFQLAKKVICENEELAQRYAAMARKIAMAARVRIPHEYRRQICRHCKRFILPGVNCRVRIQQKREPHVTVTCSYCGKHMRFPMKNKKREKRYDYAKD